MEFSFMKSNKPPGWQPAEKDIVRFRGQTLPEIFRDFAGQEGRVIKVHTTFDAGLKEVPNGFLTVSFTINGIERHAHAPKESFEPVPPPSLLPETLPPVY